MRPALFGIGAAGFALLMIVKYFSETISKAKCSYAGIQEVAERRYGTVGIVDITARNKTMKNIIGAKAYSAFIVQYLFLQACIYLACCYYMELCVNNTCAVISAQFSAPALAQYELVVHITRECGTGTIKISII